MVAWEHYLLGAHCKVGRLRPAKQAVNGGSLAGAYNAKAQDSSSEWQLLRGAMLRLLARCLCHRYLKRVAARAAPVWHPNALCQVQPVCDKEPIRIVSKSSKIHSLAALPNLPADNKIV